MIQAVKQLTTCTSVKQKFTDDGEDSGADELLERAVDDQVVVKSNVKTNEVKVSFLHVLKIPFIRISS